MKENTMKAIFVSVGTLLVFLIAAAIAGGNHNASVNFVPAAEHPGYETQTAYYFVEASTHKMWVDSAGILRTIGFIIAALTGFTVIASGGDTSKSKISRKALIAMWVVAAAFIFGSHASKFGSADYTSKLCPTKYEAYKDKLDSLFPNTLHPEEVLNNCK